MLRDKAIQKLGLHMKSSGRYVRTGDSMLRMFQDRKYRTARIWSNKVLRQIAPVFKGNIINVSGWHDEDKEGCFYREYFSSADTYRISNLGGYRGESADTNYVLDLEGILPDSLKGRFDVVYNHTTLEHVFDVFTAVRNLCELSNDVVIVVVPFIQEQHTHDSFSDYWRFTPAGIKALFSANGMETVLLCSTPGCRSAVYHLLVTSKFPGKWTEAFNGMPFRENKGEGFFANPLHRFIRWMTGRTTSGK